MRIRKFNESLDSPISDYIQECFIDYIDSGSKFKFIRTNNPMRQKMENTYYIHINAPIVPYEKNTSKVTEFMDSFNEVNNLLEDIRVCIEKLRFKYDESVMRVDILVLPGSIRVGFISREYNFSLK